MLLMQFNVQCVTHLPNLDYYTICNALQTVKQKTIKLITELLSICMNSSHMALKLWKQID